MSPNKDKGKWRGRRTRCILADYRYRRYAPCYWRLSCLECLLVSDRIWCWNITDTRSAQAYATWSESRKIRGGRQPDDKEEEEEERPSGVAAKPIPSDSLFIFRRAYLQLNLCSVCVVLSTWQLLLHSCGAILRKCNRATLLIRARQISRERNPLSCSCISHGLWESKVYQIFGGLFLSSDSLLSYRWMWIIYF